MNGFFGLSSVFLGPLLRFVLFCSHPCFHFLFCLLCLHNLFTVLSFLLKNFFLFSVLFLRLLPH